MRTLIIDYPRMCTGGIEASFSKLMRCALDNGYRVIWLALNSAIENSHYDITNEVEIAVVKPTPFGPLYPKLHFDRNEEITLLSCEPIRFVASDRYRKKAKCKSFNHFLCLPHFVGGAYYHEMLFHEGLQRKAWKRQMAKLANTLASAGCVRGFSIKHIRAYDENYCIGIENPELLVPPLVINESAVFDEELAKRKADERSLCFTIVSCARFDFPHKGFLIGLLKSFPALKKKYPQLRLVIVGYGSGETILRQMVDSYEDEVKQSIRFTGRLSEEELMQEYQNAHLGIGVAGALRIGAQCGIPSIVMRHNTYSFEGYGPIEHHLEELSDAEGIEASFFVDYYLQMPNSEYVDCCRRTFCCTNSDPDMMYYFTAEESLDYSEISGFDRLKYRFAYLQYIFMPLLMNRSHVLDAKNREI